MIPDDREYTAEHEWVAAAEDGHYRVGITDFAQQALGDIVFVSVPEVGTRVGAGQPLGEVESTKSVSEIYAPFAGEVVSGNGELSGRPELINSDPYGDGWIVTLRPESAAPQGLLSPQAYREHTEAAS